MCFIHFNHSLIMHKIENMHIHFLCIKFKNIHLCIF
nr:MAG TPA: hypothetical protein [Caudoviricetes sp.]